MSVWFVDYICTRDDLALIEFIKNIPWDDPTTKVEVVSIPPDKISREYIECLFQPNQYLGDEVISSFYLSYK